MPIFISNGQAASMRKLTTIMTRSFEIQRLSLANARNLYNTPPLQQKTAPPIELPKQPLPKLTDTLTNYLRVVASLTNNIELRDVSQLVIDYEKSENAKLSQQWLENRYNNTDNWLADLWLKAAYLEPRYTPAINVSPALSFPPFDFHGTDGQIQLAARMAYHFIQYKLLLESDRLPADPGMDMSQHKLLFGTSQIPKQDCDIIQYGIDFPSGKHMVVMHNGRFFEVPILNGQGEPASIAQLEAAFRSVISKSSTSAGDESLGICSTMNRNDWAKIYQDVKEFTPNNKKVFESLERAQFIVNLDQQWPDPPNKLVREIEIQLGMLLHGGGARHNSNNRWFDKCIQLIVGKNGRAGVCYLHSPAEGPAVATLMDYTVDQMLANNNPTGSTNPIDVTPLAIDFNESHRQAISDQQRVWNVAAADIEISVLEFRDFGKNLPKKAKMSPDSFIQIAFQMTYFRLHHAHPPTYETGTLRRFYRGRTDTIRLPNPKSIEFNKYTFDTSITKEKQANILLEAVQAHQEYGKQAMTGKGIDRHLVALKMAAKALNLPTHPIFDSPIFRRMLYFQVSTSQVPTKHEINLSFGPATSDCYGICYNPKEDSITFTTTTFANHPNTRANRFNMELAQTLHRFRDMLVTGNVVQAPKL